MLQYIISEGIIDVSDITKQIDMNKRKKYLSKHHYSIWQGKNGKWYTKFDDEKKGKVLKKRNTEKEIQDLVVEFYRSLEINPSIKDIFNMWVKKKIELCEIGRSTYDRYMCDFSRFFVLDDFQNKKIKDVDENDLEYFIRKSIAQLSLTSKAYSNLKTLILGIFKFAKKEKYTTLSITNFIGDLDLSRNVFRKKVINKEKEVFFEDEIKLVTQYITEKPSLKRLGILLAFQTGLRVGELCTLMKKDITKNNRMIHIQRTEIRYKDEKTNKQKHDIKEFPKSDAGDRYLIVPNTAIKTIEEIIKLNPDGMYLFEQNVKRRADNSNRIYGESFGDEINKICKELKITPRSMHKIRKTYGTTLLDGDVDESIIVEQMGHSDIKCTKQYYYYSNKNTDKKIAQIDKAISI